MAEDHFEVRKEGAVLTVVLGENLSVVNASALTDEINLYKGQDIEKLVFDATKLTYISSSGIRVILYCKKFLSKPGDCLRKLQQGSPRRVRLCRHHTIHHLCN